MAIIRAKQLWCGRAGPSLNTLPAAAPGEETRLPGGLNPRVSTVFYTCPPGKRAIIRSFSVVLLNQPPTGEQSVAKLLLSPTPGSWYIVQWNWFVEHTQATAVWRFDWEWNGQMVLHAGQAVALENVSTVMMDTQGSGHELNEIT